MDQLLMIKEALLKEARAMQDEANDYISKDNSIYFYKSGICRGLLDASDVIEDFLTLEDHEE